MTEKIQRKHNSPKKYYAPNPEAKNPRILCPECEKLGQKHYLKKTTAKFKKDGKFTSVTPVAFCLKCPYVLRYEDKIKEIPD